VKGLSSPPPHVMVMLVSMISRLRGKGKGHPGVCYGGCGEDVSSYVLISEFQENEGSCM